MWRVVVRPPAMNSTHGPSPEPTQMRSIPGGQWTKSRARSRSPSMSARHSPARTGSPDRPPVIEPAGPSGPQHGARVADLAERRRIAREDACIPERVAGHPRRVADAHGEPPVLGGDEPDRRLLHPRLRHHAPDPTTRTPRWAGRRGAW